MKLMHLVARAHGMDDTVWMRHANPWSGLTRLVTLPVLILAIWSRLWLGWWCILPIAGVLMWTWANPRLFSPPRSTRSWISRAVLGERVWLNRHAVPIPDHHHRAARWLAGLSAVGIAPLAYGLIVLELWPTITGATLVYVGKLWFLDRMVWLYADMRDAHPDYGRWLY